MGRDSSSCISPMQTFGSISSIREIRPTMRLSRRSTDASGSNGWTYTGSRALRLRRKIWRIDIGTLAGNARLGDRAHGHYHNAWPRRTYRRRITRDARTPTRLVGRCLSAFLDPCGVHDSLQNQPSTVRGGTRCGAGRTDPRLRFRSCVV